MARTRGQLVCTFCGKRQDQVQRLIAGPGVYICAECVGLCNEILADSAHLSPDHGRVPGAAPHAPHQRDALPWWRRLFQRWRLSLWQVAHTPA
jgi:hypothetical protein